MGDDEGNWSPSGVYTWVQITLVIMVNHHKCSWALGADTAVTSASEFTAFSGCSILMLARGWLPDL